MEQWKSIEGYGGRYQISDQGRFLSFGRNMKTPTLLKYDIMDNGYAKVYLYKDKKRTMHYAHRLVAEAFLPNPDNRPEVNHEDANRLNNAVSNLKWVTSKENTEHSISHGLRHPEVTKMRKRIKELERENARLTKVAGD